ncbi:hypothetical protein N2603_24465 [Bradyrhizobium huanghuaihaiense]|uniref:hypothetical protein n=1 Tax=Bradyrhizobium huanghuaihaiense TaxID=990078 RepID=UPI0021AA0F9A|nr:hypothetical protein [Bradyrhizobium sp. CB3035]UWU73255.1 hypothetical protein N2603_24465 [Bradyrhizobium sp. CB3035]
MPDTNDPKPDTAKPDTDKADTTKPDTAKPDEARADGGLTRAYDRILRGWTGWFPEWNATARASGPRTQAPLRRRRQLPRRRRRMPGFRTPSFAIKA